ncbi:MAG: lysophospholipid acyltransferase family protein [Desulfomonile sp.]|nr:lysophospholipid acyltransferase family protein [Desulfomonile sp.]
MGERFGNDSGPRVKVFLEYLVYLIFRGLEEAICRISDDRKALALGAFLGRVMFVAAWGRREVAVENLTLAFGREITPRQTWIIARKNFEHLGMLSMEFFRLRRWSHEDLARRLVLRGQEHLNKVLTPGGPGILLVLAHFGSFEVLAALHRYVGLKSHLVVTGAPNRFVNKRMFFQRGGSDSGLNILPHRGIVHRVIAALKAGESVAVLADQRGDDTRPVWVDFFDRKVLANGVFARFAVEGAARAIPARAMRTSDGRYLCEFGPEIPIDRSDNVERDIEVNSQRFHQVFESWLREYPELGFWMHRKFNRKSKRRSAPALAALQPVRVKYES